MEVIDKINRIALNNYFKRVNFNKHLIPLVKKTVRNYSSSYQKYGVREPYISVISEEWLNFHETQTDEIWSDSITIAFGNLPIGLRPVVPVKNRRKILHEKQVSLVLSQSISGDVMVFLYPPESEIVYAQKKSYIIEHWADPLEITERKLRKIIKFALIVNAYCKSILFPNKKALRLMAQIEAKDSVISNGGSRIWVWAMFIAKSMKGVARIYGLGAPHRLDLKN